MAINYMYNNCCCRRRRCCWHLLITDPFFLFLFFLFFELFRWLESVWVAWRWSRARSICVVFGWKEGQILHARTKFATMRSWIGSTRTFRIFLFTVLSLVQDTRGTMCHLCTYVRSNKRKKLKYMIIYKYIQDTSYVFLQWIVYTNVVHILHFHYSTCGVLPCTRVWYLYHSTTFLSLRRDLSMNWWFLVHAPANYCSHQASEMFHALHKVP